MTKHEVPSFRESTSLDGSDGVIAVQIIGAPLACADGVKDTWREVARHAADQLMARFGGRVRVQYFDLFDADCPVLPDGAQLPLVLIEGEVLSSGGKISTPAIRKRIEALSVIPMVTEVDVRAALDRVLHPTFGMSLIALNMVHTVRVSAERIEVDLVMNCPGCPAGEVALAQARQDLAALSSGIVRLNLLPQVWTPPWNQDADSAHE